MSILEVKNLTHSFGEKVLYSNVNFELFKGEHMGIVGQNGTGKTTLLRSVIGEITPDSGEICWGKGIKSGYLDQQAELNAQLSIFDYLKTAFAELYQTESKLNKIYESMAETFDEAIANKVCYYQNVLLANNFYETESNILKVAAGLGIDAIGMDILLKNLSGGQRAKVILAKLLLEEPDVLLLDEPTNFLDAQHINWLTDYLITFEGAFLVISHDFDFLNKITNCILDIEFKQVTKYSGNFDKFVTTKGLRQESYMREFSAQQKEIKKQEDYIAKWRYKTATAKTAQSRIKKLEKMDILPPPQTIPKPNFKLISLNMPNEKALIVENLEIGYTKPLLPKINFEVGPKEKIVITGFNGVGKSTLLKTLLGLIPALSGSFKLGGKIKPAYFEQDLVWENKNLTPLDIIKEKFLNFSDNEARKHLAAFGLNAKHMLQKIGTLSGGEQSRVKLCILANTRANFLILDEPTNHFDEASKEALKEQLLKWEGSLILVSHEESFYKGWADKIIKL